MRASRTMPPLHALRAFEAVGRLLSFRRAGEELFITQSAVSYHIAQLECALGLPLFLRSARRIELTPAGERYLQAVRSGFDAIAAGTAALRRRAGRTSVRVSLLPSFAANWLVPRLDRFSQAHPNIDLALDPTLRVVDVGAGEADIAIRYGEGEWPGVNSTLLMSERLSPIMSKALRERGPPVNKPRDVLAHTLLFTRNPVDWEVWAEAHGLNLADARTIQLTDYNIVLQAATEGHGIALGRLHMIADRIRDGTWVLPCRGSVESERAAHWLVQPRRRRASAATSAFVDWLIAESAAAPVPTPSRSAKPRPRR